LLIPAADLLVFGAGFAGLGFGVDSPSLEKNGTPIELTDDECDFF